MSKPDYSARSKKAWDTRGRASRGSGSNAEASKGDYSKDLDFIRSMMGTGADSRNPVHILGAQHSTAAINAYLARAGAAEMQGQALPANFKRAKAKECYVNATRLVLDNPDLDFVEGIGYPDGAIGGLAFMHAWAVDKAGKVIDPTWDKPQGCRYYGVRYDRAKYLKHIARTKMYGVLGGDATAAQAVLDRGGL